MNVGDPYRILLVLCCAYAVLRGRKDGRWAAGIAVSGAVLTHYANQVDGGWDQTRYTLMAVDTAIFIALFTLMANSRRYWPIWLTGFQLIEIVVHLATIVDPNFGPNLYRALESLWAIPKLISMVSGIFLDRRADSQRQAKESQPIEAAIRKTEFWHRKGRP